MWAAKSARSLLATMVIMTSGAYLTIQDGYTQSFHSTNISRMDTNHDGIIKRSEWRGSRYLFENYDLDKNGRLSGKELNFGNNNSSNRSDQFNRIDRNDDGYLHITEWDNTRRSFDELDRNYDRRINRDEFYNRSQMPRALFGELDTNDDRRISRSEWPSTNISYNKLDVNGDNILSENEFNGRKNMSAIERIFFDIFKNR